MHHTILYAIGGLPNTIEAIWSIRSLLRFIERPKIHIICSNKFEMNFIKKHFKFKINFTILKPKHVFLDMAYKTFVLDDFFQNQKIFNDYDELIISDTDIIYKKNPKKLFDRIINKNWFHKIIDWNSKEILVDDRYIPEVRITTRTIKNFLQTYPDTKILPNYIVNGGLFACKVSLLKKIFTKCQKINFEMGKNKMLMADAVLSMILANLNETPISDFKDIKKENNRDIIKKIPLTQNFFFTTCNFSTFDENIEESGYDLIKHFYGDQREYMYEYVKNQKLDPENNLLKLRTSKKFIFLKKRIINKLKMIFNVIK